MYSFTYHSCQLFEKSEKKNMFSKQALYMHITMCMSVNQNPPIFKIQKHLQSKPIPLMCTEHIKPGHYVFF